MPTSQSDSEPASRHLVFLPPSAWDTPGDSQANPQAVNPGSLLGQLAAAGVRWRVLNPLPWPWNPWARGNAFLRGLDPLRALRVLLQHRDADAVVSVFESNALFILLLRRLFFFKPRVVLWDASTGNTWRPLRLIQRLVLPRYDLLLVLYPAQADYLRRHYHLRGPVVSVGYNVAHIFYAPPPGPPAPADGPVLVVGDDISRDYPTLFAAALQCDLPFVIKSRWRPPPPAAPPPARITFVSQRLAPPAFRALYADARMVALSLHEMDHAGGITALFEAMAMGRAIVATDTALTRHFVTDGVHALLTPPGDPHALARAITRLAHDDALRQQLGAAARRRIETDLSVQALAQRMRAALRT